MFKHYLITRLSEQDEVLRARYVANEKIFALVLGIVPEGNVHPYLHMMQLSLFILLITIYNLRTPMHATVTTLFEWRHQASLLKLFLLFTTSLLSISGQAKVRESLSYTAYKNMLKNILRYKESVEPQDLQQFVILKDSLDLGMSIFLALYNCSLFT